jgi:hypothetical protein
VVFPDTLISSINKTALLHTHLVSVSLNMKPQVVLQIALLEVEKDKRTVMVHNLKDNDRTNHKNPL